MRLTVALASSLSSYTLSQVFKDAYNASYKSRITELTQMKRGGQLDSVPLARRNETIKRYVAQGYEAYAGFVVFLDADKWRIEPHAFCVRSNKVYEVTNAYDWGTHELYYMGAPVKGSVASAMNSLMRASGERGSGKFSEGEVESGGPTNSSS